MTGETDTEIPETGAVFTFGKSKIANNVPSRLWLKNDIPVHISCGQSHSAFVTEQGRLFVFGNNNRGQLGLRIKGPVNKPTCVKVLKGERAQFVACGTDHTLVSTSQGDIFAAGGNSDGQLGLGHCNDSVSFQRLHPFCDYVPIKLLSAGGHTSAALTEDGRLFLWGDNSVGQLGLGNESHALLPKELKLGQSIQWVSCGYRHSALVTENGDVFTFGESADGRLGLSAHHLANHSDPQRVDSLHGVLQVACGGKHTLALTEDELYSFGRGEFGQLGLGTLMFLADTPVAVGHFRKGRVTHVTCGENHSALITDSGLLYTFGDGRHGKLGLGDENFTNQFSPTVCQRFFDYSVMTVACGSSHMLVFARPRQQESEEVRLEDEDVTYSYLDRCYTSMLKGQPLEHIPETAPALFSQPTFLPSSLPTSHRWSLSTRARRRQRESSSAQFGPEFSNLPPPTTGFTALALTGNILQPRSPTDAPKCFKTEAFVESASTSITLPARTTPLTQITKNEEDFHSVGTSENSISDKTHEENKHSGMVENIPQQVPTTKEQAGSVSHSSVTESPLSCSLKNKKPRSGDPKNPAMAEEHSSVLASKSKKQSKTYNKTIQSKKKVVEVRLSSDRMSAKEKEGSSETCSTYIDPRDKTSNADKYSKVKNPDSRGQEVTAVAEMEKKTKSSPIEIQKTFSRSSPVQEVEQVRAMPIKVQEVKSLKIKEMGIPVGSTKRVKTPVKDQNVPSGSTEVSKVKSTPQAESERDIKPSLGNAQELRSTLINTQEQGNSTPVKIPAKMQSTSKKEKENNDVDTEESPSEPKKVTPKKTKKKGSNMKRAPMSETAPKTPGPLSVSIPTRISKGKKGKPVESKNSSLQLKHAMPAQEKVEIKRQDDSKIPQNSDISFPSIKNQKSGGTAEKSLSASNLQSDQKNSQSPTDKVLTEQKHEFPSIKSLAPERGHSFPSLWSNNQSATNKSSTTKETESSSGKLLSPSSASPQHKQSPQKNKKIAIKTVEPKEPDRMPQAEHGIMGSVVSSLTALATASAEPLLIKAAEVLFETQPQPSIEMSSHASVSKETSGSNILLEQEVDSTVQDVSAIMEREDCIIRQQSAQDQNELVSDENEMWVSGDGKIEEEEHEKYGETEREEEGGEKESLTEEEDELEEVGQEEEDDAVEDEEERESKTYEDRGESAQQGEEENEEEGSEAAREEENDNNSGQSSKSEGEMSKGEESGDETEREEGEQSEGQQKEESEEGETDEKEEEDEESGGEEKEEERESWDEGSEREMEEEEKTDAEEEQEGESSNEEKTDEQSESDNEQKNESSDEQEGESEEKDESESEEEEEKNETVKGEGGQEEKGEEGSEEEDEVGNEDEEENQEEGSDHEEEEEEERRDQAKEEVEENNEEEEGEEDKEEEGDEEENNEEPKDKDGVTNKSAEEESVREKQERQNKVEAEDEEKMSETDVDKDREKRKGKEQLEEEDGKKEEDKKEGEMDTGEEKFREEENLDTLETRDTVRGDEDDETDKLNEMEEENNEKVAEEEETDQKENNKTTERIQRKQRETNDEEEEGGEEVEEDEEEEKEQENNIKTKKNRRKQSESSEVEEESEEEEEESEQEENIKTEKNRRKQSESSEVDEEQEEESGEGEVESEQEENNIKTEKNSRKQSESSEEEEEQEEEEEESEQEENIKTEKYRKKQSESSEEEEEEQEEESEEEEEEEKIEQIENNIKSESSEEEEEQSEGDEEEHDEEETELEEKNKKKDKHGSYEEEEQEEEGEEEEEEEMEQEEENLKTEKNERKRRETSEEEEEQEEETEEEEEEGEEQAGEEEEEGEEEEQEEEKTKKVTKQRAKPDALPSRRQTSEQRDRQKTRQRHQKDVKGKKQSASGAQDPQFWNNVLPQYLNLK